MAARDVKGEEIGVEEVERALGPASTRGEAKKRVEAREKVSLDEILRPSSWKRDLMTNEQHDISRHAHRIRHYEVAATDYAGRGWWDQAVEQRNLRDLHAVRAVEALVRWMHLEG